MTAARIWIKRHPELWVSIVLFSCSYAFVFSFGRVAHWTTGIDQGRLANFCKWDCGWYERITAFGYDSYPHLHPRGDAASWAFFPLFPLSADALKDLFHLSAATALVLASKLEYFLAIFAFLLWMRPHLQSHTDYYLAGSLIALNPYLIYGHAGYSEPLYFTLACLGFWALEHKKWVVAGLLGAGLSSSRLVGLLFVVVYVIVALRDVGWRAILKDRSLNIIIGLLLCPLGLVLFALYLYHRVGDALAFVHIQIAWGRSSTNPVMVLWNSYHQHGWFRFWTVMAVAALLISVWLIRKRPEYGIFLALSIIVPTASGSLFGFPRYLWWQPPFLYILYFWLRRSLPAWMMYLVFAGGMASFLVIEWFANNNLVT